MSKTKAVIEVAPNAYFRADRESFTLRGFECNYCNGRGKFTQQVETNLIEEKPCECCHGTGRLKALVEIAWVSDEI